MNDPRLQLNLMRTRQRELEAQAENDRLCREVARTQPGVWTNVLVALGDLLVACGLRLNGARRSVLPSARAVVPATGTRRGLGVPEMALRIWQIEGDVTYSLTYSRSRMAFADATLPGTYYSLTWMVPSQDVSPVRPGPQRPFAG